jgi:hypothetical protein
LREKESGGVVNGEWAQDGILRLHEEPLGSHLKMDHLGYRQIKIAGFICNKSTIIKYLEILLRQA